MDEFYLGFMREMEKLAQGYPSGEADAFSSLDKETAALPKPPLRKSTPLKPVVAQIPSASRRALKTAPHASSVLMSDALLCITDNALSTGWGCFEMHFTAPDDATMFIGFPPPEITLQNSS